MTADMERLTQFVSELKGHGQVLYLVEIMEAIGFNQQP